MCSLVTQCEGEVTWHQVPGTRYCTHQWSLSQLSSDCFVFCFPKIVNFYYLLYYYHPESPSLIIFTPTSWSVMIGGTFVIFMWTLLQHGYNCAVNFWTRLDNLKINRIKDILSSNAAFQIKNVYKIYTRGCACLYFR